ncbi:hypothetical protein CBM2585_A10071 [Cupriavidus taiwanensis]|nr:hypothetical protein CBM2585_A10071 [Cupriavidus taiwanensis]
MPLALTGYQPPGREGNRALGGCLEKLDALAKIEARGEKSVGRGRLHTVVVWVAAE